MKWDICLYSTLAVLFVLGGLTAQVIIWSVQAWRRRKTRKAQIAAVYSQREETDPLILTPERVKFRVPRPRDYGDN